MKLTESQQSKITSALDNLFIINSVDDCYGAFIKMYPDKSLEDFRWTMFSKLINLGYLPIIKEILAINNDNDVDDVLIKYFNH